MQPNPSAAEPLRRRRAPRSSLLLLLALAACGGTIGSETPARFRLVAVDARPLPAAAQAAVPCDSSITGGTLDLRAADRFGLLYQRDAACGPDTTATALGASPQKGSRQTGIYEREGDRVRFYIGPAAADSSDEEPILRGTWTGDTLQLRDERLEIDVRFIRVRTTAPVPN